MIEYKTQEMRMIPYKDRRKIEKKVLPEYYNGIRTHKKMFELRKDEDGIKPGDILVLREWDGEKYTGGMTRREVTAILKDCPEYGLMDGYCILSLQTPGWDFVTPSAEPERKKGKWMKATGMMPPEFHGHHCCSECGNFANMEPPFGNREGLSKFCPSCGARMRGETDGRPNQ